MKNRSLQFYPKYATICLLLAFTLGCSSPSREGGGSSLPPSVDRVETFRVGEQLVRVLVHNMEIEPKLGLELLATPSAKLLDAKTLSQITLNNEVLDFANSSGVFVEGVEAVDSGVQVTFDYFYLEGGSDLIQCYMPLQIGNIGEPVCRVE